MPDEKPRRTDWPGIVSKLVGAAALGLIAAGFLDLPGIIASFTPKGEPTGSAFVIADQLRWGAGVVAVFLVLQTAGLFRLKAVRRFVSLLGRGTPSRWAWIIFGVALALRLAYALVAEAPPISDEQYYVGLARNLVAGAGYTSGGVATAYWPPGYPAFLAALFFPFGGHFAPVMIVQSVLGAVSAVLVWRLGREFVSAGAARAAGLLVALCPSQIAYASRLFPAVVTAFGVLAFAYAIVVYRGWRSAVGAGVLAGVTGLAAPVALVLVPAAWACELLRRTPVKRFLLRGVIMAAVAAAFVVPWSLRNLRAMGESVPISTNGGVNLWIGNNPNSTGAYYYPTSTINPLFMTEGELARDKIGREFTWYFVRHEPARAISLFVPKFIYTYGADVSAFQLEAIPRGVKPADSARRFPARLAQTYYALFFLGFILGLWRYRRDLFRAAPEGAERLAALLIWPAALTLVYLIFFGQDRFHFPMLPFMAILAGVAFYDSTA
ncbi:MAG: glycosyltransferase family 39 protein [Candidatus Zixiibacteriota bacterium]